MHARTHTHVHAGTHKRPNESSHTHKHTHAQTHTRTNTHTHKHTHAQTHTRTNTHTHKHTHAQTHTRTDTCVTTWSGRPASQFDMCRIVRTYVYCTYVRILYVRTYIVRTYVYCTNVRILDAFITLLPIYACTVLYCRHKVGLCCIGLGVRGRGHW